MSDINRYNPQKFRGEASQTYCAAFYKHTNIRADGNAYACCRADEPITKVNGDLSSLLHSNGYRDLRKKAERGIKLKGCSKCYLEEEHGKFSMRQQLNKKFGTGKQVKLELLEMYANNICNLTCIMCSGKFSSAIWEKNNPGRPPKEGTQALKSIPKIPGSVNEIRFMGGEPFMTSTHRKILQTMKDADLRNLYVEYNTNGQFMLTPDDHALLSRCKKVLIDVSIDAFGGLNSIVREGADWEKIDMFFDDVIKNTTYKIGVHTTLHNKGWKNFDKLAKWVESKKRMHMDIRETHDLLNGGTHNIHGLWWSVSPVTYPKDLCISRLSSDDKTQLLEWIKRYDRLFQSSQQHYIKNILNSGK